jgi:hypothetical protein
LRTQKTPQRARHDRQRARSRRLLVKKQPAQDLISQAAANARIVSRSLNQRQVNHVMKTIGVDVGGTFTDLVYCDMASGELAVHKVATTPDDPSLGVIAGTSHLCDNVGVAAATIDFVFHGTTTATGPCPERHTCHRLRRHGSRSAWLSGRLRLRSRARLRAARWIPASMQRTDPPASSMVGTSSSRMPREIAHDLNKERVPPPRGRAWNASTINGNRQRCAGILQMSTNGQDKSGRVRIRCSAAKESGI